MINPIELTRKLIDIESFSNNEQEAATFLFNFLSQMAFPYSGRVERMDIGDGRFNVFACWGHPIVTLSTHMDTVPPFIPSREDEGHIWGRGACDAKGIISAMVAAAETLLAKDVRNFGLLFVVGEERNSAGAMAAAQNPRGARYLINGEPTENLLALGSKGALRYEIAAHGKMAHSAYPELGRSAIEALLDVLQDLRRMPLLVDPLLGRGTMNIGTIAGGRAPNVIADSARAEVMIRLVSDAGPVREAFTAAVAGRVDFKEVLHVPPVRLGRIEGFPTTVVSYTTDIPFLAAAWGEPFLVGPGTIHVAHTSEERIPKKQLMEAVEIYSTMTQRLLTGA
jgi:acetylornithine deacetylase